MGEIDRSLEGSREEMELTKTAIEIQILDDFASSKHNKLSLENLISKLSEIFIFEKGLNVNLSFQLKHRFLVEKLMEQALNLSISAFENNINYLKGRTNEMIMDGQRFELTGSNIRLKVGAGRNSGQEIWSQEAEDQVNQVKSIEQIMWSPPLGERKRIYESREEAYDEGLGGKVSRVTHTEGQVEDCGDVYNGSKSEVVRERVKLARPGWVELETEIFEELEVEKEDYMKMDLLDVLNLRARNIDVLNNGEVQDPESEEPSVLMDAGIEEGLKHNFLISNLNIKKYNMLNNESENFGNNIFHGPVSLGQRNLGRESLTEFLNNFAEGLQSEPQTIARYLTIQSDQSQRLHSTLDFRHSTKLSHGQFEDQPYLDIHVARNFDAQILQIFNLLKLLSQHKHISESINNLYMNLLKMILDTEMRKIVFISHSRQRLEILLKVISDMNILLSKEQRAYLTKVVDEMIFDSQAFDFNPELEDRNMLIIIRSLNIWSPKIFIKLEHKFLEFHSTFTKSKDLHFMFFLISNGHVGLEMRTISNAYLRTIDFASLPEKTFNTFFVSVNNANLDMDNMLRLCHLAIERLHKMLVSALLFVGETELVSEMGKFEMEQVDIDLMKRVCVRLQESNRNIKDLLSILEIFKTRYKKVMHFQRSHHLHLQYQGWAEKQLREFSF